MARRIRSPFGTLLAHHRRRLGLTQRELADRASRIAATDDSVIPITERNIQRLERLTDSPAAWQTPHPATARALARALELLPGTPEYEALVQSARRDARVPATNAPPLDSARPSEFIAAGREAHLARLHAAIDAAAAGTPGAVFVGADPGTGKT